MTTDPPDRTSDAAVQPARGGSLVDRTATFLLFLPFGFAAIALFQVGAVVAMPADVCGSDGVACDFAVISAGARVASWAPLGLLILAILAATHRLVRQRIAFWIPLLGLAAVIGVVLLAGGLVDSAITRP